MARRGYGSIWTRPDREGFYISFIISRQRHKRFGGPSRAHARRLLARIETLVHDRRPPDEILHLVFGDACGPQITFRDLVPLYKARTRENPPDPEVVHAEELHLDRLAKSSWASLPISELSPVTFQRWMDARCKATSPPTANRSLTQVSAVFKWASSSWTGNPIDA